MTKTLKPSLAKKASSALGRKTNASGPQKPLKPIKTTKQNELRKK